MSKLEQQLENKREIKKAMQKRCEEQGHDYENCMTVFFEGYQECKWCGWQDAMNICMYCGKAKGSDPCPCRSDTPPEPQRSRERERELTQLLREASEEWSMDDLGLLPDSLCEHQAKRMLAAGWRRK